MALKPARLQWSGDGSLASLDYGDIYFQPGRGLEESRHVFLEGNRLAERFQNMGSGSFHIAELGFGSGLNFLLAADLFARAAPPAARLFYASVEKHPVAQEDLEKIYAHFGEFGRFTRDMLAQYPPLIEGFHTLRLLDGRITLLLLFGDVAAVLPQLGGEFDAWFLDGFAPAKNPAMWADNLYPLIALRTKPGGTAATFSAAGDVRRGLAAAGFSVEKTKGYGAKRDMTVAVHGTAAAAPPARKSVAVLGAGLAGCAAAYALSQQGHAVTVIDRQDGCAQETSGNPLGLVSARLTVDPSPLGEYHAHAFSFARALVLRLGLPSWNACGVLSLDLDDEDRARTAELFARNAFPPGYAAPAEGGYVQPMGGFLSPPAFCRALLEASGAKTVYSRAAAGLLREKNAWRILDADGGEIAAAEYAVIALGQGSKGFAQTEWLPLQSVRGQVTLLRSTPASESLDHVVCHAGYITPAVDGLHCIGATFTKEEPGEARPRAEDDLANLEKLNRRLPQFGFDESSIAGGRAGFRATTPDRMPVVGPAPDYEDCRRAFEGLRTGKAVTAPEPPPLPGLYLATGLGSHGITGAALAGEIVAAMISGAPLPVPLSLMERLLPGRFIFRGLRRRQI